MFTLTKTQCMKWLWDNKFSTITAVILASLFSINLQAEEIDPTDISYVSVNPYTNEITVSWYKSESPNIEKTRILYIYDETTLIKGKGIVDIPGNEDKTFVFQTDTISQIPFEANERPISLAVDAYAENGDNSTSLRENHTTMVISGQELDCSENIRLQWTPYKGFGVTVENYEIIEVANGKEIVRKVLDNNQTGCLIDANESLERDFYVKATFTDCRGNIQISTSSLTSIQLYKKPTFLEIEGLDVLFDKSIVVTCLCDVTSDLRTYLLTIQKNVNDIASIDSVRFDLDSISSPTYTYHDKTTYNENDQVTYTIFVFDKCGNILLQESATPDRIVIVEQEDSKTSQIYWNTHCSNCTTPIEKYRIWRSINNGDKQLIDSVPSDITTYVDNTTSQLSQDTKICYLIETIYSNGVSSFTRESCYTITREEEQHEPILLIPNAINPYSNIVENRIFKPKYAFVTGDYKMEIFDRFGGCIFTSSNIDTGWDGTAKGSIAPTGAYQYKIVIKQPNGEKIERLGVVNLIYR